MYYIIGGESTGHGSHHNNCKIINVGNLTRHNLYGNEGRWLAYRFLLLILLRDTYESSCLANNLAHDHRITSVILFSTRREHQRLLRIKFYVITLVSFPPCTCRKLYTSDCRVTSVGDHKYGSSLDKSFINSIYIVFYNIIHDPIRNVIFDKCGEHLTFCAQNVILVRRILLCCSSNKGFT